MISLLRKFELWSQEMPNNLPNANPLSYLGVRAETPPQQIVASRNPINATDNNYDIGTLWINQSNNSCWQLAGYSAGAALWQVLGGSSVAINTINTNAPVAGNYTLAGTANQITVAQTAGTSTFSIPAAFTAPGSITATTSITATLGNITATNGNIVRGTAGNKDVYSSVASTTAAGANSAGTVTLVGGTATISTTAVTASSQIRLYRQGVGATGAAALGILTLGTVTAGVSFVINAVQAADATALQASDVSVIGWEIVN